MVVFDVYRDSRGKIWLIDFNPFGEVTDSLLFTWDELTSGRNLKGDQSEGEATEQDYPAFRCTNSQVTVQPSPYLSYRLPKDFVDLSTGEDVHKLIDFLKLLVENSCWTISGDKNTVVMEALHLQEPLTAVQILLTQHCAAGMQRGKPSGCHAMVGYPGMEEMLDSVLRIVSSY
ncbi:UNVERIFIED_CONTAM: hypothetical protein H355_011994 [Colinus virginianus]|nr:hypothetical protein H355_011994 [Colinus virginianus]